MWFRVCGMLGLSWFIYKINLNVCFTEATWNLLRSTLHIKIPNDFLTPTNTRNGIKEIKLTMHLSVFSSTLKGWGEKSLNDDDCLLSVSTGGVLCITPLSHWNRYLKPSAAEWIHFLLPLNRSRLTLAPVSQQSRLHITELQVRNDSGKEHWITVTCTFYSLSNEAPHEVGTVFTPMRAPERVHLEDSSRKENYRKWPSHFTDISISACKQYTIPLWRHHMQFLEATLYHCRKGRKELRKI